MTDAPRLTVTEIELYERNVRFRMPFRFGVITMTEAPQGFARVRIRLDDGSEAWGMAAEVLAPKWFDKNPDLSNQDNFDQLRAAIAIARRLYADAGPATAFGHYRACYREQIAEAAKCELNPLVACFGLALLDKAILDALCRAHGISFFDAMANNLTGIESSDLTPDLDAFDIDAFVRSLRPAADIHARHTVGMVDSIASGGGEVNDGLPETLVEIVDAYGQRYFKLKVSGDLEADAARLAEIAGVLDRIDGPYRITLDGNEQYQDVAGVGALMEAICTTPELARLNESILFVEQPIERGLTLDTDIAPLGADTPLIIDEADGTLDAFPKARALGYRGVSSKSCKGLYKSILNAARCRHWNDEAGEHRFFMSAEDLTTQAGLGVQQDLALVSLIGCDHVERNGHHYVNGMADLPAAEQQAFLDAHPDIYHRADGAVRLSIRDGKIALGTLACPGFACAAEPDWSAIRPMPHQH
jgi:L-alanine-DL-glutamate epimerase-like enolase superfamily enzyme